MVEDDMTRAEKQQWDEIIAFAEIWEDALREASVEVAREYNEDNG